MARLPVLGGDSDTWGSVLNEYLQAAHRADGTLKLDVKTVADLKSIDVATLTDKPQALVAGYHAPGDGGGGQFYYDAAASGADNGGTILQPSVGAGRWKRIYSGPLSVRCFGATGDGVTDDTAAFAAAIASIEDIIVPSGSYAVDSIVIDRNVRICGSGRKTTKIIVRSYTSYQGIKCGVLSRGAAGSPSLTDLAQLSGVDIDFTSDEGGQVGVLISRKLNLYDSYIHGAPGDGVYFLSVAPSSEAPYFCRFDSVWMKHNGGNGCTITENCNGNQFINCQWSSNSGHGLHQVITGNGQPTAVYNTVVIGGQAAYNAMHGLFFESGSNTQVYGTYAEYNSNADGGNPKTGAYKNVQLGASVTRTFMSLGEQGTDVGIEQTIGLNTGLTNYVSVGGSRITPYGNIDLGTENVGLGRSITFRGAADCVHEIRYRETTSDRLKWKYDGVTNTLTIEAWTGSAWVTALAVTREGRLAFFDGVPQAKPTVGGSREGNAALGSLLSALANLGLVVDNTTN